MVKIPDGLKIGVIMLIGMVLSAYVNPILVFGGVVAAAAGFILLGKPLWLLIFLLAWSMTAFVWESIFKTPLLKRADDLMILLMLAVYMGNMALRRVRPVPYMRIYLVIVGVAFFSKIINGSPILNLGLFLLAYCSPYLLFCLVHTVKVPRLSEKIIKLILGVFLFGVALNVGWFLGINPIFNIHLGTVDFAKGTYGSSAVVSYFTIFIIFLLISLIRHSDKQSKKVRYGLLVGVSLVQFYLCYSNHAYFYFAVLFAIYLVVAKQHLRSYIALGAVAVIVVALLGVVGKSTRATEISGVQGFVLTDVKGLEMRWRRFLLEPKAELFEKVVWTGYEDGVLEWFFGHGPGAGVGTVARGRATPYTFKMLGDFYLTHSGQQSMVGHSITQSPWSALSSLWSEVGMIGTLLFYLLPLLPARVVFLRLMRGYYSKDSVGIVIAEAFVMYVALFFMFNLLDDFWSSDGLIFPLWVLAALALREPPAGADAALNKEPLEEISKAERIAGSL